MSSVRSDAAIAAFLAVGLSACSFGRVSRDPCTDQECQAAFGFGSTCGQDGFCARAPDNPRCTKTYPEDLLTHPKTYGDTIVIGSLMDRSLQTQAARENAAQLVVKSANDSGGFQGRLFGMVFCDIEADPQLDSLSRQDAAVADARYLTEQLHLPAIVGPSASADTMAVFMAVEGNGTLVISPAATSDALTGIDQTHPTDQDPGLLWRTAPPDSFQGREIANDMTSRGVMQVAVIHSTDAYGQGLAQVFVGDFGGNAMLFPFANDSALAEVVVQAGSSSAQEVLFISSLTDQAAAFVNATLGQTDYDSKGLFLTDSAANADFKTATQSAMTRWPQIRGTRPKLPSGPVFEVFRSSYQVEFMQDPETFSYTANAYDAAWLVLYGIAWAAQQEGSISGRNIARGLRKVSSGMPIDITPSSFQPIVTAFGQGESVNVTGASGDLDYDPATEEIAGGFEIWTVADL